MHKSNLKGSITITRSSRDVICIRLEDDNSRIGFLELEMQPEDFAMALTGLGYQPIEFTVRGLENIGKFKVSERRTITCPGKDLYDRSKLEKWLEENAKEDGWNVLTYLGSQGSIRSVPEGQELNYHVYKYVEEKPDV